MGFLWPTPTHLEQLLVKYQSTKTLHPGDSGSMSQDGTVAIQGANPLQNVVVCAVAVWHIPTS